MAAEMYGTDMLRNRLGIVGTQLDYAGHAGYVPDVITYSGLTIAVGGQDGKAKAVGRIQSWNRDATHLEQERGLSVHHLVMGEHLDEVLGVLVEHAEGQVVLVPLAVDRLLAEVPQRVVHPAHVPLVVEPEPPPRRSGG